MAIYRLFVLNGTSGRSDQIVDIRAQDDLAAIEAARAYRGAQTIELWSMGRRIKRFEALAAEASLRGLLAGQR